MAINCNKSDKLKVSDTVYDGTGNVLAQADPHEIIGEVEIIYKSRHNGKRVFTRKLGKNDLLLTGAVFLSEKVNGIRSTFKTTPIDLELGVHAIEQIDTSATTVPMQKFLRWVMPMWAW